MGWLINKKGVFMKRDLTIISIILIIFTSISGAFFISGCEKDEVVKIETVQDTTSEIFQRSGTADVIFYRTSLTTDNYLILQFDNKRIYKLFNKAKVKEIRFNATTKPIIVVNSVQMKHYRIEVLFKDSTNHVLTAYSKSDSNNFVFIPTGTNLLKDTHSAKFLQFETTGNLLNDNLYNFWLDVFNNSNEWVIKKDGINIISTRSINPINKNSNIFVPPHAH